MGGQRRSEKWEFKRFCHEKVKCSPNCTRIHRPKFNHVLLENQSYTFLNGSCSLHRKGIFPTNVVFFLNITHLSSCAITLLQNKDIRAEKVITCPRWQGKYILVSHYKDFKNHVWSIVGGSQSISVMKEVIFLEWFLSRQEKLKVYKTGVNLGLYPKCICVSIMPLFAMNKHKRLTTERK